MLRGATRLFLTLVLAASLAGTTLTAIRIASDPLISPLVDAAAEEIVAATERMLAREDTPALLVARLQARLAESPRNWMAIDALTDLAIERAIDLPPELAQTIRFRREDDHGYYAQAVSCAQCAYDAALCGLSQVMICQVPVALTPIGDIAGIARAGVAYGTGETIDEVDLALSVVGLGATAAVLLSGGSSASVKVGASLAKVARRMGRLSPRLLDMTTEALRAGVDWARLPAVGSLDDLQSAIRPSAFSALTATLVDLDRLRAATNSTAALHLLPLVDDAHDAHRLANAAEALGPKLTGRAEVFGKTRLFRATVKLSRTAWALAAGLASLILSCTGLVISILQGKLLRFFKAALRP